MNATDNKSISDRFRILSAIFFSLTMMLLFPFTTLANSTPSSKNNISPTVQTSPDNKQKKRPNHVVQEKPLLSVDHKPEFKGGYKEMLKFINKNLHYPKSAQKAGVEGTVYVSFVVDRQGKISNVKSIRGIGSGCDQEAVRIVKAMPNWIPGRQEGKIVPVLYRTQIDFELPKTTLKEEDNGPDDYFPVDRNNEKDRPLLVVEQNPEFNGGYNALMKYLKNKMIYPITAKKEGIQGTVFVQFVVERNGKITSVKLLRGIGKACDNEAMRLVKTMPDWIPGKQDGKVVRVMFQIPVKFQLSMKY